jgi:hypothetical protein
MYFVCSRRSAVNPDTNRLHQWQWQESADHCGDVRSGVRRGAVPKKL